MGCCNEKPFKDKLLEHKESQLQFNKLTPVQIQNAFKITDDSTSLIFSTIIDSLKKLNIKYSENDQTVFLKPFLSVFEKESIKVDYEEEYDYRIFISMLTLMSKGRDDMKARTIFSVFDVGNNDSLSPPEMEFMFKTLLNAVEKTSIIMIGESLNVNDIFEKIRQEIYDKVLKKTKAFFYDEGFIDTLNVEKFVAKIILAKSTLNYDYLSTSGIRKILSEWFHFRESMKNQEHISFKK